MKFWKSDVDFFNFGLFHNKNWINKVEDCSYFLSVKRDETICFTLILDFLRLFVITYAYLLHFDHFCALKNHNFQSYVETVLIMKKTKIEEIHIRFLKFQKFWVCLTTPPNLSGIGWKTVPGEWIKVGFLIFRPKSKIFSILKMLVQYWKIIYN